jgi:thiosulfate/3-mercaptopyruvate sulfurtransferase
VHDGARAALTATLLRGLGFKDVRVYKPGWLGYAGTLSAPADDEVFVNIGGLEARIDELKKEIATLKKPK